MEILIK